MVTQDLVKKLKDGLYDAKLKDIYVDEKKISYRRKESKPQCRTVLKN